MSQNIFADEWRACLQAHYQHVVRNQDQVTEPSLRLVMLDAGFTESELAELRVRATMHVDDVGPDFVPDMNVLQPSTAPEAESQKTEPPAAEPPPTTFYSFPQPIETDYLLPDEAAAVAQAELLGEDELLTAEELPEEAAPDAPLLSESPDEPEPDAPQQLSMF
ncbi:MAG TPA: hypothetical protein VHO69_13990 [Phototrophicaceae bacterium]|nr:hypothetical protein [Phototrophicaceae bacterium]